ncbi:MAG: lipase family protein, partial [Planctomycetaceae bacterium]|nr:lipase family protein [Planctomycetaceae bacterium]
MSKRHRLKHVNAAELCKLAYQDTLVLSDFPAEVTELHEITADDIRVVLLHLPERTVLVFRGTVFESRSSAVRNADYELVCDGGHRVHAGYLEGLSMVFDEITDRLQERFTADRVPLSVIGHSAGGALASIFAARMFSRRQLDIGVPQIDQLITFGSPRVGDPKYTKTIRKLLTTPADVVRYTSVNDPIPHLPPIWRGLRHGLKDHFLTSSGTVIFDPWWVRRVWEGLKARV